MQHAGWRCGLAILAFLASSSMNSPAITPCQLQQGPYGLSAGLASRQSCSGPSQRFIVLVYLSTEEKGVAVLQTAHLNHKI